MNDLEPKPIGEVRWPPLIVQRLQEAARAFVQGWGDAATREDDGAVSAADAGDAEVSQCPCSAT
jgi:hypothetical protein